MALLPLISSIGAYSGVAEAHPVVTVVTNVNWPTANKIFYVPLRIPQDCTVVRAFWANGNAVNGNVNLGLYSAAGSKLWETGSTAQSGASALQFVDIADELVPAGLYYVALQHSATNGRIARMAPTLYQLQTGGELEEAAGSFALPATATFAKLTVSYLPAFGLDLRGAV